VKCLAGPLRGYLEHVRASFTGSEVKPTCRIMPVAVTVGSKVYVKIRPKPSAGNLH
jgi:hypothetical protein